jgi:hypothetical protein
MTNMKSTRSIGIVMPFTVMLHLLLLLFWLPGQTTATVIAWRRISISHSLTHSLCV